MSCYQCGAELEKRKVQDPNTGRTMEVLQCPDGGCEAVF